MPKGKMKFKFSKKPNGGDLTGASSTREFKPQQDYAAKALAKRNQTKPDSDAQLTDYGLNKQVGESAIGRGDATSKTRFATSSQKNIMDVKGKAEGNASFKASATEIATEKMPKEKAKSIATYAEGTSGIKGLISKMKIGKKKDTSNELQATDQVLEEPKEIKFDVNEVASKKNEVKESSDIANLDKASSTGYQAKTNLTKGADASVAKWQAKRGLKADGIWGKDTQAKYEAEQKAKKSSTPKKMNLTEVKGSSYKPVKGIGEGFERVKGKSYSTKGKETEAEKTQRLMDTSRIEESRGGWYSPESIKTTKEIQKGEAKEESNLGRNLTGVGVAGSAIALGVGIYKGKVNKKALSTIGNKVAGVFESKPKVAKKYKYTGNPTSPINRAKAAEHSEVMSQVKAKAQDKQQSIQYNKLIQDKNKSNAIQADLDKAKAFAKKKIENKKVMTPERTARANEAIKKKAEEAKYTKQKGKGSMKAKGEYAKPEEIKVMKETGNTYRPAVQEHIKKAAEPAKKMPIGKNSTKIESKESKILSKDAKKHIKSLEKSESKNLGDSYNSVAKDSKLGSTKAKNRELAIAKNKKK